LRVKGVGVWVGGFRVQGVSIRNLGLGIGAYGVGMRVHHAAGYEGVCLRILAKNRLGHPQEEPISLRYCLP